MKNRILSGRRVLAALFTAGMFLLAPALPAAKPADKTNNGNGNGNGNGRNADNPPAAAAVTYGGQAIALRVDGVTKPQDNGPIVVCDTGLLPASGGVIEKSAVDFNYLNALTMDSVSAQVSGVGPEAAGETRLTNYRAEFISSENEHFVFEADLIQANVSATVQRNGSIALSSHVTVENFRVNGQQIVVTGEPNQKVIVGDTDCWIMFNEQSQINGNGSGDIGVSAIHFDLCHCIEGHIGFVHAGITAQGAPPEEEHTCGKLTGGGWITGTPSGAKATFGVSGGVRRGEFWGHLTYIDHGTGMKVESTAVTGFENDPTDANGRIITYAVNIDGVAGTATVRAVDNGEPGRDDIFEIKLSNGYQAGGDLGGARPGGGNIQLHKCPPGWE